MHAVRRAARSFVAATRLVAPRRVLASAGVRCASNAAGGAAPVVGGGMKGRTRAAAVAAATAATAAGAYMATRRSRRARASPADRPRAATRNEHTEHPATSSGSGSGSDAANANASANNAPPAESDLQLHLLTVVVRHGARTPIGRMPSESREAFQATWAPLCASTDPPGTPVPHGAKPKVLGVPGQLTQAGRQQLIDFGRWLRARYMTGEPVAQPITTANAKAGEPAALQPVDATPTTAGFLAPAYDPHAVTLRCTGVTRTQESTAGLMQGLYPDQYPTEAAADAVVAANVEIRGLRDGTAGPGAPSHSAPSETMYPMWGVCTRLRELYWVHRHAPRMAMFEASPRGLAIRNALATELGVPASDFGLTWIPLFDAMSSREYHGVPQLPRVARTLQRLGGERECTREIADIAYGVFGGVLGGSDELIRLSIGRFLDETLQRMEQTKAQVEAAAAAGAGGGRKSAAGAGGVRAAIHATHDTTILPLSFTLPGVYDPSEWAPFASNIVLELLQHKRSKQWYVRVLSNGQPTTGLAVPGSEGAHAPPQQSGAQQQHQSTPPSNRLMTLEQLRAHWKPWIPTDWEKECACTRANPPPQLW